MSETTIGDYKIPYDAYDNILHSIYNWYREAVVYKDNIPFTDCLEYVDYAQGPYFLFTNKEGREYPMFLSEFSKCIKHMRNGKLYGTFCGMKKGNYYGIKYLGKTEGK